MTLHEQLEQWHEKGQLQDEQALFISLVLSEKCTVEQCQRTFRTMLIGWASHLSKENDPDLERVRRHIRDWMEDKAIVREVAWSIMDIEKRPEEEVLTDILREGENRTWQNSEEE
ncbi:MAG TPA: hypothetical protein VI873_01380 [Candidatus Peribacteraceae bacterium]|nr:hypothetical protein [Candidatus Peribacteraceae bacterium]